MANSDFVFKITQQEANGEYSIVNTVSTVLDEDLCKRYSEDAIVKAKHISSCFPL